MALRLDMIALLAASTLTVTSGAAISPALPGMAQHFAEVPEAGLLVRQVLAAPALAIVATSWFIGIAIDRTGCRPVILIGLVLFALAGTAGFYLDDILSLLVSRLGLGIAVGMLLAGCTTAIGTRFDDDDRARITGLQVVAMCVGGVVFLGLGGLAARDGWRMPFLLYLVAVPMLPLVMAGLRRETAHPRPTATERAPLPWKTLAWIYPVMTLGMATFYAVPVQLPFLLHEAGITDTAAIGGAIALSTLTSGLVAASFGRIRDRAGARAVFVACFAFTAAGYLLIGHAGGFAGMAVGSAISGIGFGAFFPNCATLLFTRVPHALRGRAMGGLGAAMYLGHLSAPAITRTLSATAGPAGSFLVLAGVSAVMATGFLVLGNRCAPAGGRS